MDRSEAIAQFNSITGNGDTGLATQFLDASGWDVSRATSLYFDEASSPSAAPSRPQAAPVSSSSSAPKKPKTSSSSGGIRGLSDIASKEDDEERESYFAGGSEKSGVQIQDPRKKNEKNAEMVQQVFENAKKLGAQMTDEMQVEKEKFGGSGFRLGNLGSQPAQKVESAAPQIPQNITKVITFYKQGFQVNDGPLRPYDDPQNSQFLSDINEGYVPRELEQEAQGQAVHVDLVDKKHEDFKEPPKPKVIAFSGHGQTLGGTSSAPLITTPAPAREIVVDQSKPVTTIQIRTADGSRLIGKFNHDHTILDIRSWLESQKKPTGPYDLITTLPAKTLSDLNQTVKDAGLLNAAINQKYRS